MIASQNINQFVLLSTAVILVADVHGNYHGCRAILDSGSMSNLITNNFVKRLELPHRRSNISLVGVNQVEIQLNYTCDLSIRSRIQNYEKGLSCVIVPDKITDNLPVRDVNVSSWKIPEHCKLADSKFNISSEIDLLIGAQLFWDLLHGDSYSLGKSLQNTVFGWIVSGTVNQKMLKSYCNFIKLTNTELNNSLTTFWELEDVNGDTSLLNSEEQMCESHFLENYSRIDDGRFVVRIPLKISRNELGDSKQMALKRFLKLEGRYSKDKELKTSYDNFIR